MWCFSLAAFNLFFVFDFQQFDYDLYGPDFPFWGFVKLPNYVDVCLSPNSGSFQPLYLQIFFVP